MKRILAHCGCWCIIAPAMPFYVLARLGEGLTIFADWACRDSRWGRRTARRLERFAARHGVDL